MTELAPKISVPHVFAEIHLYNNLSIFIIHLFSYAPKKDSLLIVCAAKTLHKGTDCTLQINAVPGRTTVCVLIQQDGWNCITDRTAKAVAPHPLAAISWICSEGHLKVLLKIVFTRIYKNGHGTEFSEWIGADCFEAVNHDTACACPRDDTGIKQKSG